MGKGKFIMDLAAAHPDVNYLGIERYSSVLLRALQKRAERDLSNIFFLCIDAKEMADYFAPSEVSRIYLNFSDPWPKDRHAKRRLTSPVFMEVYDSILKPDGGDRIQDRQPGTLRILAGIHPGGGLGHSRPHL